SVPTLNSRSTGAFSELSRAAPSTCHERAKDLSAARRRHEYEDRCNFSIRPNVSSSLASVICGKSADGVRSSDTTCSFVKQGSAERRAFHAQLSWVNRGKSW